ncbi:hypothetical protein [Ramlibacter sp.]|uniref:hypothetical protein n=1 Tax=Ramlibacter sp. TaxID=1917967 RepID=UPI002C1039BF|nr:hypothetical protein [Ramlibacter sp.]HWI84051.1 hypothetical protein [Ramlibacter sp.]
MNRLLLALATAAWLASCAAPGPYYPGTPYPTGPSPAAPYYGAPAGTYHGPEVTYACDDLTTVVVQYGLGTAVVTLNSGFVLKLPLQGVGSGFFATDKHSFQVRPGDGVFGVAGRPPVLCRARR